MCDFGIAQGVKALVHFAWMLGPTNGFSIKPLKVLLLAGEQKATEYWSKKGTHVAILTSSQNYATTHGGLSQLGVHTRGSYIYIYIYYMEVLFLYPPFPCALKIYSWDQEKDQRW